MSKKFLYSLNGNANGRFRRYLDSIQGEPRIAWYPSAGTDFRPLLYLHPGFAEISKPSYPEPMPPDIFLFSDYFPWKESDFLDTTKIYFDDRTEVRVRGIEELPSVNLNLDKQIVDFPEGSDATGRVVFLDVNISSAILGEFTFPVLYVFIENESFCANKILPMHGQISHVIHVRYGGGAGGGGKSTGRWLLNILKQIGCEVFIHDGHFFMQDGDEAAMAMYPALAGPCIPPLSETIRVIKSEAWSNYGVVCWDLLQFNPSQEK